MANPGKDARRFQATEYLEVGENPTTCTHCGNRTEMVKRREDGTRLERCLHCQQLYDVSDETDATDDPLMHGGDPGEIEVLDPVTGEVLGMTGSQMDDVLNDLGHIKGDTPDHPDAGSF